VESQRELMKSGLNELADAFAAARPPADRSAEMRTALAGWCTGTLPLMNWSAGPLPSP
jgi:hypothetical protein